MEISGSSAEPGQPANQPMRGIRVLEVAQFTFVPAAGAVMADWGADVLKVEHPVRGDAARGMKRLQNLAVDQRRNVAMHHPNRGKRSVGIDLAHPDGLRLLYRIAATSDALLTNFLPAARRKLKIDVEDIRKQNPKIIYARGSAFGDTGPEREKGGFDSTAFWARGGSAKLVAPPEIGGPLMQPGPAYGDTISGMNLAGGIAAALLHRERTGEAMELDVSLLGSGIWATAMSVGVATELGSIPFINVMPGEVRPIDAGVGNPFIGIFPTADGGHINLTVITPGPYIREVFEHLHLAELADDARFSTDVALMQNAPAARELVKAAIAGHPFAYWVERLQTMTAQWGPYQTVLDVAGDRQVQANGMMLEVEAPDGGAPIKLVSSPVQFNHRPFETTRGPEASEHTELVLMELGLDWGEMETLKANGAIA